LAEDLERWLTHEPIQARPARRWERALKWVRRRPALSGLLAVILVSALVLGVGGTLLTLRLWDQRDQLQTQRDQLQTQRDQLQEQRDKTQQNFRQSLFDQARAERLAGQRQRSLEQLAKVQGMMSAAEVSEQTRASLQQEAIQTITTPGIRLVCEIPLYGPVIKGLSADGKMLVVQRGSVIEIENGISVGASWETVVFEVPSGKTLLTLPHSDSKAKMSIGAAFNPVEPIVAFAEIGKVEIWDLIRGKKLAQFQGGMSGLEGVPLLFSPDGKFLAAGSAEGIAVWEARTGKRKGLLAVRDSPFLFPSNEEVLVPAGGGTHRWNWKTGQQVLAAPDMRPEAFSANGQIAVLRTTGGQMTDTITLWNLSSNKQQGVSPKNRVYLGASTLSSDGRLLAFQDAAEPKTIQVWDVQTATMAKALRVAGEAARVVHLQFSPGGSFVLAEFNHLEQRVVQVWDVESGTRLAAWPQHSVSPALCIYNWTTPPLWSKDRRILATVAKGTGAFRGKHGAFALDAVQVWEVIGATPTYQLASVEGGPFGLRSAVASFHFSPDGKYLETNGTVWQVTRTNDRTFLRSPSRVPPRHFAIFCRDGTQWEGEWIPKPGQHFAVPQQGMLNLRQKSSKIREFTLPLTRFDTALADLHDCMAFSPDGKYLVVGDETEKDKANIQFWDLATQKQLAVRSVILPPDYTRFHIAYPHRFTGVRFSPDGKRVVTNVDQRFDIWDIETRKSIRHWIPAQVEKAEQPPHTRFVKLKGWTVPYRGAIFNPSGNAVFLNLGTGVCLGDIRTGRLIGCFPTQDAFGPGENGITCMAISPDGKMLALGDHLLTLWEVSSGRELARWDAHGTRVTALAFSPDGTLLVSGGVDGSVKLWDLPFIRSGLAELGLNW
jgi:WD40 repeat protein